MLVPLSGRTKSALCSDRTKAELLGWNLRETERHLATILLPLSALSASIQEKQSSERVSQSEEICFIIQWSLTTEKTSEMQYIESNEKLRFK